MISTFIVGILLVISFFAEWGYEDGTLREDSHAMILVRLFNILRFPTHTLLWGVITKSIFLFFLGLLINCMLYGFIIERMISFIRRKPKITNILDDI
jgi:hypothetical protein